MTETYSETIKIFTYKNSVFLLDLSLKWGEGKSTIDDLEFLREFIIDNVNAELRNILPEKCDNCKSINDIRKNFFEYLRNAENYSPSNGSSSKVSKYRKIDFTSKDLVKNTSGIPTLSESPRWINTPLAIVNCEFTYFCGKKYVIIEDMYMGKVKTCSQHVVSQSQENEKFLVKKDSFCFTHGIPYIPAIIKDKSGKAFSKFMLLPLNELETKKLSDRLNKKSIIPND
jgi:hypothetical protein